MTDFVSSGEIYKLLISIQQDLKVLQSKTDLIAIENSIEEVSLYRATRILKRGHEFIKAEVKAGRLKAKIEPTKKGELRYRFRIADIKEYQCMRDDPQIMVNDDLPQFSSAEELARSIFHKKDR